MRIATMLILLLAGLPQAGAVIEIHQFDDPAQEALYDQLTHELRCLVCQNQNLADSHADLAKDLREEIYEMVRAGKGKQQIIDFMVQRYGDFVLYRPPVKPLTLPLWLGPFALLSLALAVYAFIVYRRSRRGAAEALLDAAAREKARRLLGDKEQEHS
ncbi:MAG: cytochrome c-type biogenesis protein CcmH [Gammaproteobacteria bacterium]|nr:MAG: cytochrome c-type biogenesis protein CcmH [Gammaproteobacteria bacterium]